MWGRLRRRVPHLGKSVLGHFCVCESTARRSVRVRGVPGAVSGAAGVFRQLSVPIGSLVPIVVGYGARRAQGGLQCAHLIDTIKPNDRISLDFLFSRGGCRLAPTPPGHVEGRTDAGALGYGGTPRVPQSIAFSLFGAAYVANGGKGERRREGGQIHVRKCHLHFLVL